MFKTLAHRSLGDAIANRLVVTARAFSAVPDTECAAQLASATLPLLPSPVEQLAADAHGPVISAAMSAIDSLHAAAGLPWWATIAAVGVGVRTAMLPVTLKGMKASAALFPLLRQAQQQEKAEAAAVLRREGAGGADAAPQQSSTDYASILRRFHVMHERSGAPHPLWVVGSPLLQFPVFITVMASVRAMSIERWPGFEAGGAAWFPDLTQSALDLSSMVAPLGIPGAILPLCIAVSMYANIDAGFAGVQRGGGGSGSSTAAVPPTVLSYVLDKVRLGLEWMVVPLFLIALQLPQGALCYWAASSSHALAVSHVLKLPAARQALGLPIDRASTPPGPEKYAEGTARVEAVPEDAAEEFARAAELTAVGDFKGAAGALREILARHEDHPRALFALAQTHSKLEAWPEAAHAYLQSAKFEREAGQACRAWYGAGVALSMAGGREDDAIDAFARAAAPEASQQLRVRAWVTAATAQLKAGRKAEAVALLQAAAEVEPSVGEVYLAPLLEGKGDKVE